MLCLLWLVLLLVCFSWGTGNGDKGFFKVRYGVCGMLAPGDTLGVSFIPAQPVGLRVTGPVPDPVVHADNKSRTCYNYTVRTGNRSAVMHTPRSVLAIRTGCMYLSILGCVVAGKPCWLTALSRCCCNHACVCMFGIQSLSKGSGHHVP